MSSTLPIPKFASFRPKNAPEDASKTTNTAAEPEPRRLSDRDRRHHHRRHRSRSKERSQKDVVVAPSPVPTQTDDSTALFVEDRRGDRQNLVYGSLHRYSVPAFHRIGAGSVLGIEREIKIDRNFADDKGIILSDRKSDTRARREKYVFAHNEKKVERLLRIRPDVENGNAHVDNLDFIALQISRPRKRARLDGDSSYSSDDDKQHYRSIEGKAKAERDPLDEDLEWVSDSDMSDLESGRTIKFDEAIRNKNIELSRKVDEHPEDVDAWIALIDHQDNLLGWADGGHRKITSAERRSTADIKLHLYEKALAKTGSNLQNRERLLLGMMNEGTKIWDSKTQSERWEQVSQENLDSALLWKHYVDFRQCNFAAFTYEDVRAVYIKRIELLKEAIQSGGKRGTNDVLLYEHLIYTILRATLLIREAGFSELAIAVWQALLELNFFDPSLPTSVDSRLDGLQEFWDSEVPRIGEEGAKGWKNYNKEMEPPDARTDVDTSIAYLESDNVFDGWAFAENMKASASREPARTMDDTTEDDPYRLILWSDVKVFLVDLSGSPVRARPNHILLDAFLIFCHLPPLNTSYNLPSRQWWVDSFARGELLDCSKTWIDSYFESARPLETTSIELPSAAEIEEDKADPFRLPFHYFAVSPDTLFPVKSWATCFMPWQASHTDVTKTSTGISGSVPYVWVRSALKCLLQITQAEEFAEYYLAFEFCNEPHDIKKIAKKLIKQNPQSLKLYNAYAMIEHSRGNKEIFVNVVTMALSMHVSLPQKDTQDSILLWKTWAWAMIDEGDSNGALRCLFGVADGSPSNLSTIDLSSAAILLKSKRHLSSNRDYLLSSGSVYNATVYSECLALLEYLSSNSGKETSSRNQGDIASALAIFDKFSEALVARGKELDSSHEMSLQSATRLLYHHLRSGPFRPAFVRDNMTRYISLFPHNTIFLSLYAWNESRLRIDDRVRTILRSVALTEANDNIVSRVFAIRYEMRAGNIHSTLSAFENAVSSPACKSNPGLWRFYVLFCTKTKEFRGKAKEVFYRGMRACPWSKKLLMMAFTELDGIMGMEEMISVYKVMGEKELRVHVDIEHRIEQWHEKEAKRLAWREQRT